MVATATALREVALNGEQPDTGIVLDSHGTKVTSKPGAMVRLDAKASEKVEVSKGTILLLSAGPAILILILNYGGAVWSKSADDSAVKTRLEAVEKAVKQTSEDGKSDREKMALSIDRLNDKFDTLKDRINDQRTADERKKGQIEGFNLGQQEKQ